MSGRGAQARFNAAMLWLGEHGFGLAGGKVLEVTGRSSGLARRAIVNPLTVDGRLYLVAPRGRTQWVRNARQNPQVRIGLGRRMRPFVLEPVSAPQDAVPVLRAYLKRWGWQVKQFFPDGVSAGSTDAELAELLPAHPVFRASPR